MKKIREKYELYNKLKNKKELTPKQTEALQKLANYFKSNTELFNVNHKFLFSSVLDGLKAIDNTWELITTPVEKQTYTTDIWGGKVEDYITIYEISFMNEKGLEFRFYNLNTPVYVDDLYTNFENDEIIYLFGEIGLNNDFTPRVKASSTSGTDADFEDLIKDINYIKEVVINCVWEAIEKNYIFNRFKTEKELIQQLEKNKKLIQDLQETIAKCNKQIDLIIKDSKLKEKQISSIREELAQEQEV